jgi:LCP family protein required for cell wall assembly
MFLVSLDTETKSIKVIAINRNTMVPVDIYDENGEYLGRMDLQICLQHGYGDGMKLSCSRSVEAVERMFDNVPISGYIALNMGGIESLNDAIGGVTLTPGQDVVYDGLRINKGEEITLNGKQAYAFLRARDVDQFGSADMRLERHMQYITAFLKKLMNDTGKAAAVYEAVSDYMVTSVDPVKLINSTKGLSFTDEDMITVAGETILNDEYEEFHVDPEALKEVIMTVFYEEVK